MAHQCTAHPRTKVCLPGHPEGQERRRLYKWGLGLRAKLRVERPQLVSRNRDADGKESVADWDCQPDCPVRLLDAQSGERPVSGSAKLGRAHYQTPNSTDSWSGGWGRGSSPSINDAGGASRYFPQFESLAQAAQWLNKLIQ